LKSKDTKREGGSGRFKEMRGFGKPVQVVLLVKKCLPDFRPNPTLIVGIVIAPSGYKGGSS